MDLRTEKKDNLQTKVCSSCKVEKTLDQFWKSHTCYLGVDPRCTICRKMQQNIYRQNNKEERRRRNIEWGATERGFIMNIYATISKDFNKNRGKNRKYLNEEKYKNFFENKEDFWNFWLEHKKVYGKNCAITYLPMTHIRGQGKKIKTNISLDRLDQLKPYTRNNCIFVRWEVNNRKGSILFSDIKRIVELFKERNYSI